MQHIELAIHCLKFQQIFDLEIVITGKPNKSKSNLNKGDRDSVKELSERTIVLITDRDKGGAVVIWKIKDYISEANQQLNATTNYQKVRNDLTVTDKKLFNDAIDLKKND